MHVPGDVFFCRFTKELDGKYAPGSCMTYQALRVFVVYKVLYVEDFAVLGFVHGHCVSFSRFSNSTPPSFLYFLIALFQDILAGAVW